MNVRNIILTIINPPTPLPLLDQILRTRMSADDKYSMVLIDFVNKKNLLKTLALKSFFLEMGYFCM